jgi:hypothetical protein
MKSNYNNFNKSPALNINKNKSYCSFKKYEDDLRDIPLNCFGKYVGALFDFNFLQGT